jgi:DNA-binding MarR family transcriptional regulator
MKSDGRFARIPLWAASAEITPSALRVLIAIAAHLDRTGWAYPSLSTIAGLTGIARKKVPSLIAELEGAGLLRRERSKGGRGNPTRYQVSDGEGFVLVQHLSVFSNERARP